MTCTLPSLFCRKSAKCGSSCLQGAHHVPHTLISAGPTIASAAMGAPPPRHSSGGVSPLFNLMVSQLTTSPLIGTVFVIEQEVRSTSKRAPTNIRFIGNPHHSLKAASPLPYPSHQFQPMDRSLQEDMHHMLVCENGRFACHAKSFAVTNWSTLSLG